MKEKSMQLRKQNQKQIDSFNPMQCLDGGIKLSKNKIILQLQLTKEYQLTVKYSTATAEEIIYFY